MDKPQKPSNPERYTISYEPFGIYQNVPVFNTNYLISENKRKTRVFNSKDAIIPDRI
jgi:hypothetical protein